MSEVWIRHPKLALDVCSSGLIRTTERRTALIQTARHRVCFNGITVKVESLVMECFHGKPTSERRSCLFLDGNEANCAATNIVMLPAFFPHKHKLCVENGAAYHVCQCGELFPIRSDRSKIRDHFYVCDSCFAAPRHDRPPPLETLKKGNKLYKRCRNCNEFRPASLFTDLARKRCSPYCDYCRLATGPFQAGRSAQLRNVKPLRMPKVFPRGTRRKLGDMEHELVQKLDRNEFPYTTDGKLEVLENIGTIVRETFKQPVRCLLMPNLGKELAVYLKAGGIIHLNKSVMVERDELIYNELEWICYRIAKGITRVHSDVNDYIMKANHFPFKMAHLDYFYIFTEKARLAVERLLEHGKLVFVTVQDPRRWAGVASFGTPLEFRHGRVFWAKPYAGNRGAKMITYAIAPLGGVALSAAERRLISSTEGHVVDGDIRSAIDYLIQPELRRRARTSQITERAKTPPRKSTAERNNLGSNTIHSNSRLVQRKVYETRWWVAANMYKKFIQQNGVVQISLSNTFGCAKGDLDIMYNWQMATRKSLVERRTLDSSQLAFLDDIGFALDPTVARWKPIFNEIEKFVNDMRSYVFLNGWKFPPAVMTTMYRNFTKRLADGRYVHPVVEQDLRSIGLLPENVSIRKLTRAFREDVVKRLVSGDLAISELRASGEESWNAWKQYLAKFKLNERGSCNAASNAIHGRNEDAHRQDWLQPS